MQEKVTYAPELQRMIDLWHRATDLNDANAQFDLAKCLLKSGQKDVRKKAFALFKKLANQCHTTVQADAQFMLAHCYENGYGITKSYPRAIHWYKMVGDSIGCISHHILRCKSSSATSGTAEIRKGKTN